MPSVLTSLDETTLSILNTAIYNIITDVVKQLGIPSDTLIAMRNGVEINKTDNKTNMSISQQPNLPSTVSKRKVVANVVDDFDEDYLTSTVVSRPDAVPIFRDPDIDASVFPVYIMSTISISFIITSPSKSDIKRIRDDIRVRLSQGRNKLHHETSYDIIIPRVIEEFIADLYDLKNRLYPQTLENYFKANSTRRIHTITDLAGSNNIRIAVRENLGHLVGMFDFNVLPEQIEEDNETGTYKFSFPYTIKMEYPRELCMNYPVIVCNRLMPTKYLDFIVESKVKSREEFNRNISYSWSLASLSHFEAHRQLSYRIQEKLPLNLPLYDNFPYQSSHKGYGTLATFLVAVDETDSRGLLNLNDLDDFNLDPIFKTHLVTGENSFVVNPYMSLFYFGLHQDDIHFDNNILQIDNQLNVKSTQDLGLVRPTRVSLSICLDPTCLDPSVFERMKDKKDLFLLYAAEYIHASNSLKLQMSNLIIPENTFFRFFILMLNDAINKDEYIFVSKLIDILSLDKLLIEKLAHILANNTPNLYNQICKHSSLQQFVINPNYKKEFMNNDNYMIRSVMVAKVVATSKDQLPSTV